MFRLCIKCASKSLIMSNPSPIISACRLQGLLPGQQGSPVPHRAWTASKGQSCYVVITFLLSPFCAHRCRFVFPCVYRSVFHTVLTHFSAHNTHANHQQASKLARVSISVYSGTKNKTKQKTKKWTNAFTHLKIYIK